MAAHFNEDDEGEDINSWLRKQAFLKKWLVKQVFIARELGDEHCFFVEALREPQWKEILTELCSSGLTRANSIDAYSFATIVDSAKNLGQVQWITKCFEITADLICDGNECPALKHAVWTLDFRMAEWLVTHFSLNTNANVRKRVAQSIANGTLAQRAMVDRNSNDDDSEDSDDSDNSEDEAPTHNDDGGTREDMHDFIETLFNL
jgi:hypothetical protein